jgi:hypothetical protein
MPLDLRPALLLLLPGLLQAELKQTTLDAFAKYIQQTEARIDRQLRSKTYLWSDESQARLARVQRGEVVIEPCRGVAEVHVPGGLIHDWIGSIFIPGATLSRTLALVQNYDDHMHVYQPEVIHSRLLVHDGNDFKIHLRLLKKKVLTVVLNTDHEVHYFPVDGSRCHSRSYSTRIAEVEHYGTPDQHELEPGQDHGFLWRLYSYWRFQERDGGTYVECEAISLTRGIPMGTGWIVRPIVRSLPRESLTHTLSATRVALASK